jgi:hypothetical protein
MAETWPNLTITIADLPAITPVAQRYVDEAGFARQKIGQSDLAAMTGIGRESANRIINDWQRRQIISRSSGYYCIENKDQLQHEAELSAY